MHRRAIAAVLMAAAMMLGHPARPPMQLQPVHRLAVAEAQAAGVPRAVFDAETRGLEPDTNCPT